MNRFHTRLSGVVLMITLVLGFGAMLFLAGCSDGNETSNGPAVTQGSISRDKAEEQILTVMDVQNRHTPDFFQNPDVVGTATTLTEDGTPAILVFTLRDVRRDGKEKGISANNIPQYVDGVPVLVEVSGPFKAMVGEANRAKQTPPIQLGTSGGWRYDLANGYCCGGTLGSLIQKGGAQYILSNYHVLEADIVSGGNSRVATAGDPVVQPGLIDITCNAANGQNVATLSGIKSLPGSNVDAAIAQVVSGMVRTDGSILGIGTLSASTVAASINKAVKKAGRTTGLTRSTISALNATISVQYENECAGGVAFTKTFTGQIVVKNKASKFLNSGDSGSLMVEDVTTNPRAIGLLFAGSTTTAIANPIGQVLTFFGATMVGQ